MSLIVNIFLCVVLLSTVKSLQIEDIDKPVFEEIEPILVGGTNAILGQFPAQVAIYLPNNTFCGGSILNNQHILTAASCVLDDNKHLPIAAEVQIVAGVIQLVAASSRININRVFIHPLYNPFTHENDIAVLRTLALIPMPPAEPQTTASANLNTRIIQDNSQCQVVGWNIIPATQVHNLQVMNLVIQNRDLCNNEANHRGLIRESMMCATTNIATAGICLSNRGGGLYCNNRLVGIISNGFGCGLTNIPGIYTQVRFYQEWIDQQFTRQDIPQAGTTPMPGINLPGSAVTASTISLGLIILVTIFSYIQL